MWLVIVAFSLFSLTQDVFFSYIWWFFFCLGTPFFWGILSIISMKDVFISPGKISFFLPKDLESLRCKSLLSRIPLWGYGSQMGSVWGYLLIIEVQKMVFLFFPFLMFYGSIYYVIISAIQQSDSYTHMHTHSFADPFPI